MTRSGLLNAHARFNQHGQYFDEHTAPMLAPVPNKVMMGNMRSAAAETLTLPPTAHSPRPPRTYFQILAEPRYLDPEWSADSQSKVCKK